VAPSKRKLGGWLLLAAAVLAYGLTALQQPGLAAQALTAFLDMLRKVAPVLLLVLALMFLAERYLTLERTRSWLGRDSGVRGWLLALLAGVLSTGPVYAWYGLLAELRSKGMRPALVVVVLYARAIKLPLLPLLAHYFGLRYALVLSLVIAAFALLNGLVMERVLPAAQGE
jgi:uncharacterized membrane protein YraQ (UPF0718 family)